MLHSAHLETLEESQLREQVAVKTLIPNEMDIIPLLIHTKFQD